MFLKGTFKDTSVFVQLVMLIVMLFTGSMILYAAMFFLIISKFGFSPEAIMNVLSHSMDYPDLMRNILFFQTVCLFIFPAIVCGWLYSNNYKQYLRMDTPVNLRIAGLAVLGMLVALPFINCTYAINRQMVFPEALKGLETWMRDMEDANNRLLEKILYVHNTWDLIFNILVVCVIAAIGEELMFRGLLQNLCAKIMKNPHIIIWTIAILFSAIHFQFYGFVPRLLLGAYLGYLVYYTQNIWIPALAHFTNNCFGVVTAALYQDSPDTAQSMDNLGYGSTWWLAVASLAMFLLIFGKIKKIYCTFAPIPQNSDL